MRVLFLTLFILFFSLSLCAEPSKWSKNVKHSSNGLVVIRGIPEVDQKGSYCVPGSVSMVLRYFDSKLSQDRLAKLFESNIREGTSLEDMIEGFSQKKLFEDFDITEIYSLYKNNGEYGKLLKAYIDLKNANSKRKAKLRDREINTLFNREDILGEIDPEIGRIAFSQADRIGTQIRTDNKNAVLHVTDSSAMVLRLRRLCFFPIKERRHRKASPLLRNQFPRLYKLCI